MQSELYEKYRYMLPKICQSLIGKTRLTMTELMEEAEYALAIVIIEWDRYKESICSPSTWVWRRIYWKLLDVIRNDAKKPAPQNIEKVTAPAKTSWISRLFREIGEEATALVQVIITAPADIADDIKIQAPKKSQETLKKYFSEMGWSTEKYRRAWREVEECLSGLN